MIRSLFLPTPAGGEEESEEYYPNGSPYRVQRQAANVRERKRMLRYYIQY